MQLFTNNTTAASVPAPALAAHVQPQNPNLWGDKTLNKGDVILEVKLGLGKGASNSSSSLCTLRGTDPVGGVYTNRKTGSYFMKVALSAFVYDKRSLMWDADGLPKTALVNGALRVPQNQPLSEEGEAVLNYLRGGAGGLVPVDPFSPQAEAALKGSEKALKALAEIRSHSGETRKAINTRQAWAKFRDIFFGGDYPVMFSNVRGSIEREGILREIQLLADREELKNFSLVVGYKLSEGGQPCWTERDESTVGRKVESGTLKPVYIPGTEVALTTRPVNIDIAYIELIEGKNRVVDPSKTLNKDVFAQGVAAFLETEDESSDGIGQDVLQARRDKWDALRSQIRGEAGKKKAVKARKDKVRSLASQAAAGNSEAAEELREIMETLEQLAAEGSSPHWRPGVVEALKEDINLAEPDFDDEDEEETPLPAITAAIAEPEEKAEVVKSSAAAYLAKARSRMS